MIFDIKPVIFHPGMLEGNLYARYFVAGLLSK
jgi:hypothetical protein